MSKPIYVDYEYGDLMEVILGRGIMRCPDVERAGWVAEAVKVLPEAEAAEMRERSGRHSCDLPKYQLVEAENNALIEVFDRFGVIVHRPDELTDAHMAANYGEEWLINGYLQTYSRDPLFVVGHNVIELTPGAPNRRAELLGYRRLFNERLLGSGAKWFQMPMVDVAGVGEHGCSSAARRRRPDIPQRDPNQGFP